MRQNVLFAAGLLVGTSALAHHSPAAFDMATEVVVEGAVVLLDWKNPHVYLTVRTTGADGRPIETTVEGGPISFLQTTGLTRDSVASGAHVVVRANPSRRPGGIARGLDIILDSTATFRLNPEGRSAAPPPTPADDLAGIWVPSTADFAGLLGASRNWPTTPAANAARVNPQTTTVASGVCVAYPLPMLNSLPQPREIEIDGKTVSIRYDAAGVRIVRTVHLDQTEHAADVEPTSAGHSIGRWEGDTLVIDTIAFTPSPSGIIVGVPSGPKKHMVERLSLTEDRLRLRHEFTLDDTDNLVEPVSFTALWDHRPDLEMSVEACDPETARRFLEETR